MVGINHLSGLHSMLPNLISVRYLPYEAGDVWDEAQEVTDVEKRPVTKEDRERAELGATVTAKTFHLWTAKLHGTVCKNSDKLTDNDDVTWVVQRADLELGDQRWRLVCLKTRPTE